MFKTVLVNSVLVSHDGLRADAGLVIADGKIERILDADWRSVEMSGSEVIDLGGDYLCPGFIDLHVHASGHFRIDDGPEALGAICQLLPRFGVTAFLATVTPRLVAEDVQLLSTLASSTPAGSQILGFHLEGPFLALLGAFPKGALAPAKGEGVRGLREACGAHPAVFSISPEMEGILELIPIMAEGGVPVFMTHTAANVEQTRAAVEAGVRHATHFYDVFPPPPEKDLGVRPCGAVEVVLADPRVTVDFILDGEHVDPIACRLALRCKGIDGVSLITDAGVGTGLPPGRYHSGHGYDVVFSYSGGPARIAEDGPMPGVLAGSGLTMDMAVRNARRLLGLDLHEAVVLASSSPARVLGLGHRKGSLEAGFDADLVRLDKDLRVKETWIGGVKWV